MRVALISDIHGHFFALETVLADIDRESVDQIVCLGDVATLGPQPCETVARLKTLGCACIMGNHDAFLINPDLIHEYTDVSRVIDAVAWCRSQLAQTDLDYIRSFVPHTKISLCGEVRLFCFHGTPESNTGSILATTPPQDLDALLPRLTETVMAGGHTHVQMLRQHKGTIIINPGSIGMPFKQMPFRDKPHILPWAEYAILKWTPDVWSVDLRRVRIDLEAVYQAALNSDIPWCDDKRDLRSQ